MSCALRIGCGQLPQTTVQCPMSNPPRNKALDDAVEWLRVNKPNNNDLCDLMIYALATLTPVPPPRGDIPLEEKEPMMENALVWICSNEPKVNDLYEPNVRRLSNVAGILHSSRKVETSSNKRNRSQTTCSTGYVVMSNDPIQILGIWMILKLRHPAAGSRWCSPS